MRFLDDFFNAFWPERGSTSIAIKLFLAITSLLFGSFLYVGFRTESLLMFNWAELLNLSWLVDVARAIAVRAEFMHNMHFIFCLPYALWVISFCCFVGAIWNQDRSRGAMLWRITAPSIAVGSELFQLVGLLPGTFDAIDLLTLVIASMIGIVASLL